MDLKQNMYVDDVIGGKDNVEFPKALKPNVTRTLDEVKFKVHKWHSNLIKLDGKKYHNQLETELPNNS